MKYETPELGALTPAISAVQGLGPVNEKTDKTYHDSPSFNEMPITGAYADWE